MTAMLEHKFFSVKGFRATLAKLQGKKILENARMEALREKHVSQNLCICKLMNLRALGWNQGMGILKLIY
jgi:hypothetical protein